MLKASHFPLYALCLERLAEAKIRAASRQVLRQLSAQAERGIDASDAVQEAIVIVRQSRTAFERLGLAIEKQHHSVIRRVACVKQPQIERMLSTAETHLQTVLCVSAARLRIASDLDNDSSLFEKYYAELLTGHRAVLGSIRATLEQLAEQKYWQS